MRTVNKTLFSLACALGLAIAPIANAIPHLQLDIAGGTYVNSDETIYASSNSFTLYALGLDVGSSKVSLTESYYISAALIKKGLNGLNTGVPPGNLAAGTFTFRGATVNVTSGMAYGYPPIEGLNNAYDSGDLPKHGIYSTYFKEFAFTFSDLKKTTTYNAQDGGHTDLSNITGGTMYYVPFEVDVSLLTAGYGIHFDLYSEEVRSSGKKSVVDVDVNKFAPFSHDAAGYHLVPDGGDTLALLGLGLIGFGFMVRRKI